MDEARVVAAVKQIMPAVVSIMISRHFEHIQQRSPKTAYPFFPVHGRPPQHHGAPVPPLDEDNNLGGGSGFIVDPAGLIITNKHVVSDEGADYTVVLNDGRSVTATVLSRDPINDVAILHIPLEGLPVLALGDAATLDLGESVLAVGNALGVFKNTVSYGIVSGLSRSVSAQADPKAPPTEMRGLIQTDAAINPGNSGGPLVTLDGKAIGINAALISGAQSIGLAIPINAARRDLDDLKKYGRIRRPYLGLRYVILDEEMGKELRLGYNYGAFVTKETPHDHGVVAGSPAAKAGLRERDIILAVNGKKLNRDYTFQEVLDEAQIGDTLQCDVLRDGQIAPASITLEERTANA
jgi:serine protease Do